MPQPAPDAPLPAPRAGRTLDDFVNGPFALVAVTATMMIASAVVLAAYLR